MSENKWTPGPWAWFGNTKYDFYLATQHSGRLYVMDFVRKGMKSAQPRFRSPGCLMVNATDIPIFEVCRDATDAKDERVYRKDIVGFRSPDAHLIAASPMLAKASERAFKELMWAYDNMEAACLKFAADECRAALALARGEDPK